MTSTSETGHAKNVANLVELNSFVTGYGATYNPSNASIQPSALQTLASDAKNVLKTVDTALSTYSLAVGARETVFSSLSKLVTRIINSLKACGVNGNIIDSANSTARKIQGKRASAKMTPEQKSALAAEGKESKEISSSQMSYDNRLENFNKLIELLVTIPEYSPNEEELKTETLKTLLNDLETKNNVVITASTELSNARLARNELLYKETSGLYDLTNNVKSYIKSAFGATSPQYKQLALIALGRLSA